MSKTDAQRPRLGRGLSSLINVSDDLPVERSIAPKPAPAAPSSAAPSPSEPARSQPAAPSASVDSAAAGVRVVELPIDSMVPNPHQPRREMDAAKLKELADSIKASGLIQPITVRLTADGQTQLIAGERRWRAAKLAGLTTIPAIVREVDVYTQAQMALIENIQREDLNPIDRAQGYQALIEQLGLTQGELATRLGEDRSTIANHVRLLELVGPVQQLVKEGKLSFTHAKLLVQVTDRQEQQRLAQLVLSQDLNARNLERLINGSGSTVVKKGRIAAGNSMHLMDLEKKIAAAIGMRVQVRSRPKSGGKGRLVIHYANLDQFDDLMSKLGIKLED